MTRDKIMEEAAAGGEGALERVEALLRAAGRAGAKDLLAGGGPAGQTPLMAAAANGDVEMALMMLAHGADVNAKDPDGWTALLMAAAGCTRTVPWVGESRMIREVEGAQMIRALLAAGADANGKDANGWTALMRVAGGSGLVPGDQLASIMELAPVTRELDCSDETGRSALTLSALYGRADAVSALLAAGANPRLSMSEVETPLIAAAMYGHLEVIRALLEEGDVGLEMADVVNGMTALMHAVAGGYDDCVRELLKAGANAGARRMDGKNSLEMARARAREGRFFHGPMVAMLEESLLSETVGERPGRVMKARGV